MIKEEFEKLHQFLRDEEAARTATLREEEEQKGQMMKMKLDDARKDVLELTKRIRETEEDMAADDASVVLVRSVHVFDTSSSRRTRLSHTHAHTHTHTHTHRRSHTHTHTHTQTLAHMHTHTCTHR